MSSCKSLVYVITFYVLDATHATWTVDQWNGIVDTREIFVDGIITTMRNRFNVLKPNDNIPDMDTFILVYPNVMYTALKCKYLDAIIDVLQTFYELFVIGDRELKSADSDSQKTFQITWLNMAFIYFRNLKPAIVKMIYNLFFYRNKHPSLRTSDQSLLKSVLSINLFLYYVRKDEPYKSTDHVCSLNTAILQMIGLLESFRLKNCYVKHPNANYTHVINQLIRMTDISKSVNNISSILEPKTNHLRDLIDNGPVSYDEYNDTMYDPNFILLGNVLEFNYWTMANFVTLYKGEFTQLNTHYENAIATYDIVEIFGYQNLLIDTMIDIFFRQIFDLHQMADFDPNHELHQNVLKYFIEFATKIMPRNCSTSACQLAKNFVHFGVYKNSRRKIQFIEKYTIEQIKHSKNPFHEPFWIKAGSVLFDVEYQSFWLLVENILKNEQFQSFSQTYELLSYESNINRNYSILKLCDVASNTTDNDEDQSTLRSINNLRNTLFSFCIKLKGSIASTKDQTVKSNINSDLEFSESPFNRTSHSLKILFNNFENHPKFQNILLPLLVHLHYERRFEYYNVKLGHLLHLTIVTIDNYIFQVYKSPPSNIVSYSEAIVLPRFRFELDLETSMELLSDDSISSRSDTNPDFNEKFYSIFSLFDYNWIIPGKYDEDLIFHWDGCESYASYILRMKCVTVINYQDLVQYQWFTIKWFLSNILLKIKYALAESEKPKNWSLLGKTFRQNLKNNIDKFAELQLPITVMESITEANELFKLILTDKANNEIKVATVSAIDKYVSTLGLVNTTVSYKNVNDSLNTDIKNFQKHLNSIKIESVVFANDMNFSNVLFPV